MKRIKLSMTREMDVDKNGRMDWFFNQWVYGTEIPSYKFEYQITGDTISGRITQSGVSEDFRMQVPVYLDFGKGWNRLGTATVYGNSSVDLNVKLPAGARRASICALNDVLALSIDNAKR